MAEQAKISSISSEILQEALDREARCQRALVWLIQDGRSNMLTQIQLLQQSKEKSSAPPPPSTPTPATGPQGEGDAPHP
jgi:hypothetical protein